MKRFVFQGDSITDCHRDREDNLSLGDGYATRVAGHLGLEHPGQYEFINRGISGDRIVDLYARIKKDLWNFAPDICSLYVGVNDVWHHFQPQPNGVEIERFEHMYRLIITETLTRFPQCQLLLIAPYVLPGLKPNEIGFEQMHQSVCQYAALVEQLAKEFDLPFLALQPLFDHAMVLAPAEHWAYDGVHPTPAGHALIAKHYLETFGNYF